MELTWYEESPREGAAGADPLLRDKKTTKQRSELSALVATIFGSTEETRLETSHLTKTDNFDNRIIEPDCATPKGERGEGDGVRQPFIICKKKSEM